MESGDLTALVALVEGAACAGATAVERPYLVMLSGLPGAGKSSLCRELRKQLSVVVIESDAVRSALVAQPSFSSQESERVFGVCMVVMGRLLQRGLAVVMDATNLRERHREPVYHLAERCGVPLVIVRVEAPGRLVRQRLEERAATAGARRPYLADWEVYRRMRLTREPIARAHVRVDTSEGMGEAAERVVAAVRELSK